MDVKKCESALINRDDYRKRLEGTAEVYKKYGNPFRVETAINILNDMPVIPAKREQQRKQAHWVHDNGIYCSNCGSYAATDTAIDFIEDVDQHYCYNCGCEMHAPVAEQSNGI